MFIRLIPFDYGLECARAKNWAPMPLERGARSVACVLTTIPPIVGAGDGI